MNSNRTADYHRISVVHSGNHPKKVALTKDWLEMVSKGRQKSSFNQTWEIGISSGGEDGVNSQSVNNNSLYT